MRHNRNLAYGMLLMWGFVLSINILFRHAHRLPNGRIVSHVHPFKWTGEKGPVPYNPHSSAELAWLDSHSNGSTWLDDPCNSFSFERSAVEQAQPAAFYQFTFFSFRPDSENPRGPPAHV